MALIGLQDVTVGYGGPPVLDAVSLQVEAGERVCLLGRNGAGKSTLMKILEGEKLPDSGTVSRQKGLRVARLTQEVPEKLRGTVRETLLAALRDPLGFMRPESGAAAAPNTAPEEGWEETVRIDPWLTRLGLEGDSPFASLSGGLRRRVFLACALLQEPDLLLLDEPTNHLDLASIAWMEDFLLRLRQTLVFVTHDRMFLKKLANRIVEIDRGRLYDFDCGYDRFLERKEALLEAEAHRRSEFDKKLAEEEAWLRRGVKARRARNEGRVRALMQLREERRGFREKMGTLELQAQEAERSGSLVLECEGLSFGYGAAAGGAIPEGPAAAGNTLIRDFSCLVMRGDRIGLVGPNGAGKSTLIRLLLGELQPGAGTVKTGTSLRIGYFDQLRQGLPEDLTAWEAVAEGKDQVTVNGERRHVLSYLQDFLFSPEKARTRVDRLSGGERNRLLLAKLFTRPTNVLVLDEPTNDLDLETLDVLAEFLQGYPGTVFLVSHDRAFLDEVAGLVWAFEGGGKVKEYVGGYSDWLRQGGGIAETPSGAAPALGGTGGPAKAGPAPGSPSGTGGSEARKPAAGSDPVAPKARKLSNLERKELAELPGRIEGLETEQARLLEKLADPAYLKQAGAGIGETQARLDALEAELTAAYARWQDLEGL